MTRILGFLGLIIALAVGAWFYTQQMKSVAPGAASGPASPRAAIDLVGVKNDLLSLAKAEKQEFALNGKYLSLDELRSQGTAIPADHRGPYTYSAEIGDTSFRITATYSGPDVAGVPKTLSVSDNMQIETQ